MRAISSWIVMTFVLVLAGADARELAGDPAGFAEAELVTVGVSPLDGVPVALLRTIEGGELVPIFIGPFEARAILLALQGVETPRPMTHDLVGDLLKSLGAGIERLLIDDLVDGTFLGMLELAVGPGAERRQVDTRPSDGLALAVRAGAGIFIAPRVIAATRGQPWEGLPGEQVVRVLGITVVEATPELRRTLGLPDGGVLVSQADGMAARSGVNPGSLILAVNDTVVNSPLDLLRALDARPTDGPLRLRLWQDGEERELALDEGGLRPAPELSVWARFSAAATSRAGATADQQCR
jgi:bifunctional DNase/RNase